MTSSLSVRQGILTRSIHRLSSVIRSHGSLLAESDIRGGEEVEDRAKGIKRAIVAIETEVSTLESSLEKYAKAADSLDSETLNSSELSQRISSNIEAAQELLDQAQQALTTLAVLQRGTEAPEVSSLSGSPQISEVKLSPIPVPKFSGEIWEWESFWKTFEHTIHSRNIENIYKLNYLMDALQGAAKESVKQFQISGETYPLVIAHLKRKYGDSQALVDQLLSKLQSAKANSDSLEDQETLCEQLLSIASQLDFHGEHIDNTFLQRELLGKFSIEIQRQILRQKPKLKTEGTWNTMALLRTAKEFVEAELRIIRQVESHRSNNKEMSGMEERRLPLSRYLQTAKSTEVTKLTNVNTLGFAKDPNSKQEIIPDCSSHDNVMLLTGQAKVLNPTTGALESIYIMLDTGADRSFISEELADRLQLPNYDTTELTLNTFGTQKPMKKTCSNTVMKLWDVDGNQHTFTVTRIGTITPTLARSSLSKEDKRFLYENEIHLSIDPSIKRVQPTVLLGCADLFSIIGNGLRKQYTLPSGLKVIPSKLGYLISGRRKEQQADVGSRFSTSQSPEKLMADITIDDKSHYKDVVNDASSPPNTIPDPSHRSPLPLPPLTPTSSPTILPHPVHPSPPPPPSPPTKHQPTTPIPHRPHQPAIPPSRTPTRVLSAWTLHATPNGRSSKRTPSRMPSGMPSKKTPIKTPSKMSSRRTPSASEPSSIHSSTPSRRKKVYIKETIETAVTTTTQNVPGKPSKTKRDVKTKKLDIYPDRRFPERIGNLPKTEIIEHKELTPTDKHKQRLPETSQRSRTVWSTKSVNKSQPKWKRSDSSSLSSKKTSVCRGTFRKFPFSSTALVSCFTSSQVLTENGKKPLQKPIDHYRPSLPEEPVSTKPPSMAKPVSSSSSSMRKSIQRTSPPPSSKKKKKKDSHTELKRSESYLDLSLSQYAVAGRRIQKAPSFHIQSSKEQIQKARESIKKTTQETIRRGEALHSQHYDLRLRPSLHHQDELRLGDLQNSTTNHDRHHTTRVSSHRYGSSGTPHQLSQQLEGTHNVDPSRSIENHSL